MSGYLAASPDTSRVSIPGSLSRMKSARTGSRAKGFTSGTDPSPSYNETQLRASVCLCTVTEAVEPPTDS